MCQPLLAQRHANWRLTPSRKRRLSHVLCNEINSSKNRYVKQVETGHWDEGQEEHRKLNTIDTKTVVRPGKFEARNTTTGERLRLGCGEQIKAKGRGKGGWQPMKCDYQSGSVRWTGIAREALFPGKPPMRTLRSGQDLFWRCFWQ